MKRFPEELKYTETHEWVYKDPETNKVTIGVTDYAQENLGELVVVELPEEGLPVSAGDDICVLESVKTAVDVLSPLSGKILAVNTELEDAPGLVNTDPYGDGWLYKLELKDIVEYDELFNVEDYRDYVAEISED